MLDSISLTTARKSSSANELGNNVTAPDMIEHALTCFYCLCLSHTQGGAFFFLEHVMSDPSSWTYFFQHVLEPLWYYLGDGCRITRATWKDLEAAGFSELHLKQIEAPEVTLVIRPHIMGFSVK